MARTQQSVVYMDAALKIPWTGDVFFRLLTAEAIAENTSFITADREIRKNLKRTIW
jgi:PIN domain nuclease of toxin-antitoxin system